MIGRRVIIRQSAVPYLLTALLGSGAGFMAGHAMGGRLSAGLLRQAFESGGELALRVGDRAVTLMSIQAATAVICAVIVPAVTVLVLHSQLKKEENERKSTAPQRRRTGRHRGRRNRDRRPEIAGDPRERALPDSRHRDSPYLRLATGDRPKASGRHRCVNDRPPNRAGH